MITRLDLRKAVTVLLLCLMNYCTIRNSKSVLYHVALKWKIFIEVKMLEGIPSVLLLKFMNIVE